MSNRVFVSGASAIALALGLMASGPGVAADYSIPSSSPAYAASADPVEFGSGWYIRGDLGGTLANKIGVSDVPSFNNLSTAANPSAPELSLEHSSNLGYDASLGAGYQINNWLRADVGANFNEPVKASATGASKSCPVGTYISTPASTTTTVVGGVTTVTTTAATESTVYTACTPTNQANLNTYSVLANLYLDLGKYYGISPYVGAGAGIGFGHYQTSSQWFQANKASYNVSYTDSITGGTYNEYWDRNSSGQFYNLAWALMAGFSLDIYSHTKLDVGYRYLNLGTINTGSASLNLYSNEVRAGLRYMIDN